MGRKYEWWRKVLNKEEELVLKGGKVLCMKIISSNTVNYNAHIYAIYKAPLVEVNGRQRSQKVLVEGSGL